MRRYRIPNSMLENESEVRLTGEILHHIRDVCRMRIGSKFEVLSEDGRALLVEITAESRLDSIARVLSSRQIPALPTPYIHLALAVPRFPVFEAVLEKAVELGVKSIQPVYSEFSFIRRQDDVMKKKWPRFEKIILGATQQSGRGDLLKLEETRGLEDILRTFNQSGLVQGLFAYEGAGVFSASEGLQVMKKQAPDGVPKDISVFVGAEGGFSDREVAAFQAHGLQPVTLGGQVLRVETACVALISVIKYAFDLMR